MILKEYTQTFWEIQLSDLPRLRQDVHFNFHNFSFLRIHVINVLCLRMCSLNCHEKLHPSHCTEPGLKSGELWDRKSCMAARCQTAAGSRRAWVRNKGVMSPDGVGGAHQVHCSPANGDLRGGADEAGVPLPAIPSLL